MIRAPVQDVLKISLDAFHMSDFALKYKLFIINYKFWINAEISRQNEGVISHPWHDQRVLKKRLSCAICHNSVYFGFNVHWKDSDS